MRAMIGLGYFLMSSVYGASLGVVGEVFVVEEDNLVTWIESQVQKMEKSGALQAKEAELKNGLAKAINHPPSLTLKRTDKTREHYYRPGIRLNQDVLDEKGHVLFPKGYSCYPLEIMPHYAPYWLLFDGEDEAQVLWALFELSKNPHAKVILTGGDISKAEQLLNVPIYFDQGGRITRKLNIQAVPALVSRDKHQLRIQEIAIGDDGHAR